MERRTSTLTKPPKKKLVSEKKLDDKYTNKKETRHVMRFACMNSTKVLVLLILCLQNSMFTILRRYSQGVLKEDYSKVRIMCVMIGSFVPVSRWLSH